MSKDPREMLLNAAEIIEQRGQNYGGIESNFQLIANLATLKLGRKFHPYEICVILESVKDARRFNDPTYIDNDIDGVNYRLFAASFADDYADHRYDDRDVRYRNEQDFQQATQKAIGAPKIMKRKTSIADAVKDLPDFQPRANAAE